MTIAKTYCVHAACIRGVEAIPVTVEVSNSGSIPGITIVGMADSTVLDARQRIRCALRSSGFSIPRTTFTVSLAPGDVRKTGSGLDLPIAIAILALSGQIPIAGIDDCLFAGELALDGAVKGVRGEVAYQALARELGLMYVGGWLESHVPLSGISCRYLKEIGALVQGVEDGTQGYRMEPESTRVRPVPLDFSDVCGQEIAKRGMCVAAAGGLGLLMVGAPGSGKTMLARRMTGILPAIDEQECQDALQIHSVIGEPTDFLLRGERPYRSPHHSISAAGLVGGGRPVRPGEISLAHGGVLYLDELAEFPSHVLQMLRQPLEDGLVRIVRVDGAYTFPARFQLVAASNPCPCGYYGDRDIACRCSDAAIHRYRSKLGGPLADRIDIILNIARPDPALIMAGIEGQSTADLRDLVETGRAFCAWREAKDESQGSSPEAHSLDSALASFDIDADGREVLLELSAHAHLSGRGMVRLSRIARTIADIAESERVQDQHVLEASQLQGRRGDECL